MRDAAAVSAVETRDAKRAADAAMSKEPVSPSYGDEDEEEPPDTDLSQPLSPDTFVPFLQQHELSLVNFYAPWCCEQRLFTPAAVNRSTFTRPGASGASGSSLSTSRRPQRCRASSSTGTRGWRR